MQRPTYLNLFFKKVTGLQYLGEKLRGHKSKCFVANDLDKMWCHIAEMGMLQADTVKNKQKNKNTAQTKKQFNYVF